MKPIPYPNQKLSISPHHSFSFPGANSCFLEGLSPLSCRAPLLKEGCENYRVLLSPPKLYVTTELDAGPILETRNVGVSPDQLTPRIQLKIWLIKGKGS